MSTNFVFREILKILFRDHLNTSQWGFVFPVKPILSQKRQCIRKAIICISYPTSALFKICSVMLIQTTKYWSWRPKAFLSSLFNFQGSIQIPIERRGGPGPGFANTFRDGPCIRSGWPFWRPLCIVQRRQQVLFFLDNSILIFPNFFQGGGHWPRPPGCGFLLQTSVLKSL